MTETEVVGPQKVQAWFVHSRRKGMLRGLMVLENGWVPYDQQVLGVGNIIQILWESKPERQEIFKKMGVQIVYEPKSFHVSEIPKKVLERNAKVWQWQKMMEEYKKIEKELSEATEEPSNGEH